MKIEFRTRTLEKNLCSECEMRKAYGDLTKKLRIRMAMLASADNLGQIPHTPPFRLHKLTGNRTGQYGIDINENVRLILEPSQGSMPLKPDGGHDISWITSIRILSVEDYH